MKKSFALIIAAILLFTGLSLAEGPTGTVAKVTTKKGPLKLRTAAG